jgi:hypothetical protein
MSGRCPTGVGASWKRFHRFAEKAVGISDAADDAFQEVLGIIN